MTNRMIVSHIEEFQRIRQDWVEILYKNPGNSLAAQHILSVNSKLELLRSLWDWTDESVEMPWR